MSIIDKFLSVIVPHDCLVCSHEGLILCAGCMSGLPGISPMCFNCQIMSKDWKICDNCVDQVPLLGVLVAKEYAAPSKRLLWKLKNDGLQEAAQIMALEMAKLLPKERTKDLIKEGILVPASTSNRRRRQRGYDQALLLAKELHNITGIKVANILRRSGEMHQVGSNIATRKAQLKDIFKVKNRMPIKDKTIILVDDVVTTGATLSSAAVTLMSAGAKEVLAICFAHPKLRTAKKS